MWHLSLVYCDRYFFLKEQEDPVEVIVVRNENKDENHPR